VAFAFGSCLLGLYFMLFWHGKLLEGKRIIEGKMLKRDFDRKSAPRTLT
jgi:hypothetical protein